MKKILFATAAVFALAQAAPAIAYTNGAIATFDASHGKCKKGEKMDKTTKKCVKIKS